MAKIQLKLKKPNLVKDQSVGRNDTITTPKIRLKTKIADKNKTVSTTKSKGKIIPTEKKKIVSLKLKSENKAVKGNIVKLKSSSNEPKGPSKITLKAKKTSTFNEKDMSPLATPPETPTLTDEDQSNKSDHELIEENSNTIEKVRLTRTSTKQSKLKNTTNNNNVKVTNKATESKEKSLDKKQIEKIKIAKSNTNSIFDKSKTAEIKSLEASKGSKSNKSVDGEIKSNEIPKNNKNEMKSNNTDTTSVDAENAQTELSNVANNTDNNSIAAQSNISSTISKNNKGKNRGTDRKRSENYIKNEIYNLNEVLFDLDHVLDTEIENVYSTDALPPSTLEIMGPLEQDVVITVDKRTIGIPMNSDLEIARQHRINLAKKAELNYIKPNGPIITPFTNVHIYTPEQIDLLLTLQKQRRENEKRILEQPIPSEPAPPPPLSRYKRRKLAKERRMNELKSLEESENNKDGNQSVIKKDSINKDSKANRLKSTFSNNDEGEEEEDIDEGEEYEEEDGDDETEETGPKDNQAKRQCSACGTKETSMWRRGPEGTGTLCNRCGVRFLRFGTVD